MTFTFNHISQILVSFMVAFFITGFQNAAYPVSCTTTGDYTWDCGIPNPSYDLIVNHIAQVNGIFNATGNITVNSGGQLTFNEVFNGSGCNITVHSGGTLIFHGDAVFSSNSVINNSGTISFSNDFTLDNSAALNSTGGYITAGGNILITQGSTLTVDAGSILHTFENLEFNSNGITINGSVDIEGEFINRKNITGSGLITYITACSGGGTINGVSSATYCGSGTIDLSTIGSCGTDTEDPVITNLPADISQTTDNNHGNYGFKKKITIDNAKVSGTADLNNFPLLVNFTDADLKTTSNGGNVTNSNGYDIVFTASDGTTLLDHQIEKYDASVGEYIAWVRIPILYNDQDTDIYMYYGNASISADPSTTNTWSSDYSAVWHLEEAATGKGNLDIYQDATANNFDGDDNIAATGKEGKIGQGQQFGGAGSDDYIDAGAMNPRTYNDLTFSTWYKSENNEVIDDEYFYIHADGGGDQIFFTITDDVGYKDKVRIWMNVDGGPSRVYYGTADVVDQQWHHIVVVRTATNILIYVDGANDLNIADQEAGVSHMINGNGPYIGNHPSYTEEVDGHLDEIRLSSVALSSGWIATEYNNQNDPVTFYSAGPEELNEGLCGAIVTWTLPSASDNCSISSLMSSHNSGDFFPVGTTTVTYTATDDSGNTDVQSFNITITENINPSISGIPADISQNVDAGTCGAIVNWTLPTASDNCSISSLTSNHNPGDFFPVGTTTVTYTATDGSSNTDVQSFDIIITDNINPSISGIPADISQNADAGACGAIVSWTLPTASDNCSASLSSNHNPGDFFDVGTTIVTYTATDIHGNSTMKTFDITIEDNIAPTIANMPADITQSVSEGNCGAVVNWTLPTATDNCSASLSSSHNTGDFFDVGSTTVTYTATDVHGNSTTLTFDVTINDNIPPTIVNIPSDITQNADAGACGAIVNWSPPTITDNCSASLSSSHNSGDFFTIGTTTVTYTALDIYGNSTVQSFDVAINDNIPPAINNLPADITQNTDAGACGAIVNWTLPIASDNCSTSLSSSHNSGDFFDVGITTVTYTATDIHGNSTVQTFDITVVDNINPIFNSMPANIVKSVDAGVCGAIVNWTPPTASDNCSFTLSSSHNPGDFFIVGLTVVTYTALDDYGNSKILTFNITINDNTPPTIVNMPSDITQDADAGACGAIVNWTLPTANDNCSASLSSSHNPGDFFTIGTTTVTYTATDIHGNSTVQSFDITINDNIPPVINNLPADMVQDADAGACGAVVNWTLPNASDNCSASLSSSHNPGDFFTIGTTTVTYTATDIHGNSTVQSFDVMINDNILPTLVNIPSDITQNADAGACGAIVNWTLPTANDNCSASLSSSHNPGDFFDVGTTIVTYKATDIHRNSTVQSFDVTINDNIPPVINNLPADITQNADAGSCGAVVNWTLPTASDNCSASLSSSHNPGDFFDVGTTTVTYTALDIYGNSTVQSFDVTINDDILPVINNLPSDITQNIDPGLCGAIVSWTPPTITDNCSASLSSSHNPGNFFDVGITTITYTATDIHGNSTVQSFDVTINDDIPPVINNLPSDITQNVDPGVCGAVVNWTLPTSSDNCSASLSSSHNPGDLFNIGTTTVTYTALDNHGNSTVQSFDITINDNTPPTIVNMPSDITQDADVGACGAIVNWTQPTATDNCSATLSSSHNPGDFFNLGTTIVTYTALDDYGNSAVYAFDVTVEDNNGPVFVSCPSSFTVLSIDTLSNMAIITWIEPTASDPCSSVTMRSNYKPGDTFDLGRATVIYTATDELGNETQCSFEVVSGYNHSPIVNNSARKAKAGEPLDIIMDAHDPDGDQVFIDHIDNNENNSTITNINVDMLTFVYTAYEEFYGFDTVQVTIADDGSPSSSVLAEVVIEVERKSNVEVSSAITANGDMINDQWHLKNIDLFPDNMVYIYDRWGGLIYKAHGYDNTTVAWNGKINQSHLGNQEFVSSGTYFYVIDLGNGAEKLTGAVEVIK